MTSTAAASSPAALAAWLDELLAVGAPRGRAARRLSADLLDRLGRPQDRVPTLHVVGTAGKGTVGRVLTDQLVGAGLGVLTHQSPHVHDLRERFQLDGRSPDWALVLEAARPVVVAGADMTRELGRPPSFFAATAAIAWSLGCLAEVDTAVIEAGIGGRDDATNVMARADVVTVITAIGLDHTDVLGSTVAEIARHKSAVMEGRRDAVLAPQPHPEATEVVRALAAEHGVTLHEVASERGADFRVVAGAVAVVAAGVFESRVGRSIPPPQGAGGLSAPGRMEIVERAGRRVVLDGAHGPLKLGALARALDGAERPVCAVVAIGRGKDLHACAAVLARFDVPVVVTEFGDPGRPGPRSHRAADVVAALEAEGVAATAAPAIADAAAAARSRSRPGDTLVVTGSFLHLAAVADALDASTGT